MHHNLNGMQSPWGLDASWLVCLITPIWWCQTLHLFLKPLCLLCLRAFANTPSAWMSPSCPHQVFIHPSLNIFSVKFLLEVIHCGPWASIPAYSCHKCQEYKSLTTHYPGHFSALCLQREILRADEASCLPLTVKMINSFSSLFFSWNTMHGMCKHSQGPTVGLGGHGEPGVDVMIVILTVL